MKKDPSSLLLLIIIIAVFNSSILYGRGRQEIADERSYINSEYVLVITSPLISSLSPERQAIGEAVLSRIVNAIEGVDYRIRGDDEILFYREQAWDASRTMIYGNLVNRRNERDLIVYRGDSEWRTRRSLDNLDIVIAGLEADLAYNEENPPLVDPRPAFRLSGSNTWGVFPEPPSEGNERQFLSSHNADAFLHLNLFEYHERIFLEMKLYNLHMDSYYYEDFVLFSLEDINAAIGEINIRLAEELSGTPAAGIIVRASPPESLIIADNVLIGRGSAEMLTFSPGEIELSIRADNYVSSIFNMDLGSGEMTELQINLTPLSFSEFSLDVPGSPGSSVYWGNYYVGEAPLTLILPRYPFSYINVENEFGETASVVLRNNEIVSGNVNFLRSGGGGSITFDTLELPLENRVELARRDFYRAYGIFWVVLPAALIVRGIANSHIAIGNSSFTPMRTGADVALVTGLGYTLFQMFRYLIISGTTAQPNTRANQLETRMDE